MKISLFVLIYIPPDKNVYYRKYDIDVFDVFEIYSKLGNIAVIGDLNGRVGNEPDYILQDGLNKELLDKVDNLIDYNADVPLVDRLTEDLKTPNSFGKRILDLCKSAGLRICNGRFGDSSKQFTFQNKNDIKLKGLCQKTVCTCKKIKYNTIRWNEEFRNEVRDDLIHNAQKFEELHKIITEDADAINNAVNEMNAILTNIFEKYTHKEVERTIRCDNCTGRKPNTNSKFKQDKPWITDDCKLLYKNYKHALMQFNRNHSEENRLKLNLEHFKNLMSKDDNDARAGDQIEGDDVSIFEELDRKGT
ncbi:Hypothetical predicted protein [Mytilus galloprovincialis]|uniref:Endonuclease/exonuclease/phosphatase domain-containing protein n=1 Tax=Mytilus galloprovincialis TaxID=29158 RepID=A0A8B6F6V9_MYTGA|nr:Hypothetical predicted protein [Mytilus galloprovincialis]